jgi:hypothetical protein
MATRIQMSSEWDRLIAAGNWLSKNMPNPPLPEPQRYNIYNDKDGGVYIEFADEQDALMYTLSV